LLASLKLLSANLATLPRISLLLFIMGLCILAFRWRNKQFHLDADHKLLDSRFWYSPTDAQSFFENINTNIGKRGLNLYALTQVTLDLIFPIAYGTFLAVLITLLSLEEVDHKLIIIPLLATIADLGENIILAYLASNYSGNISSIVWAASVFTLLKWVMLVCAILLILGGVVWKFIWFGLVKFQ
jgi:hypothetical protein